MWVCFLAGCSEMGYKIDRVRLFSKIYILEIAEICLSQLGRVAKSHGPLKRDACKRSCGQSHMRCQPGVIRGPGGPLCYVNLGRAVESVGRAR